MCVVAVDTVDYLNSYEVAGVRFSVQSRSVGIMFYGNNFALGVW
ncbi:hypothetical protein [Maridesulfovibrio sp.]